MKIARYGYGDNGECVKVYHRNIISKTIALKFDAKCVETSKLINVQALHK